jgi:hypothetical protein
VKKTVEISSTRPDGRRDVTTVHGSVELVSLIVRDLSREGNHDFTIKEVS